LTRRRWTEQQRRDWFRRHRTQIGEKIEKLHREGYFGKQSVAIALQKLGAPPPRKRGRSR